MAARLTCDDPTVDPLDDAVRAYQAAQAGITRADERAAQLKADAKARAEEARLALAAAIVAAYQDGTRVGELASRTGYNRESIRRILRTAGISADS